MKKNYLILYVFISLLGQGKAFSQCITGFSVTNVKDVFCKDGNDGAITVEVTGGTAPFYFELVEQRSTGDVFVGKVVATNGRTVTFSLANGNVEPFGIYASSNYKVSVLSDDPSSPPGCNSLQVNGIAVAEPLVALAAIVKTITPECSSNSGAITLDVSGGWGSYSYQWTGPTPIGNVKDPTGLSEGTYTVDVADAEGCVASISSIVVSSESEGGILSPVLLEVCSGSNSGNITLSGHNGGVIRWESSPDNFTSVINDIGNAGNNAYSFNNLIQTTYFRAVVQVPGCPIDYAGVSVINVNNITIADAGLGQTVCVDNATLSANAAQAGETGTWRKVLGEGTFSNMNVPNATVTGLREGINQFEWAISDNSSNCASSVDTVTIHYINLISNAGANQTVCENTTSLSANLVNVGQTGRWEVVAGNGSGIFEDKNDPNSFVSGLGTGENIFKWIVSDDANNCPEVESMVTVTYSFITLNPDITPVSTCGGSDGAITINPAGGTAPYQYSVDDGLTFQPGNKFTGLSAGKYEVVVTDATGCSADSTVSIEEPTGFTVDATAKNVTTCDGEDGEIILNMTGQVEPVTIKLNGVVTADLTGLRAETYEVSVEDATGCTAIQEVIIKEPEVFTVSEDLNAHVDVTFCGGSNGKIKILEPVGGSGSFSYLWIDDLSSSLERNNLFAGDYYLRVRDIVTQCVAIVAVTIEQADIAIVADPTDISGCGAEDGTIKLELTGAIATHSFTYTWTLPDGSETTTSIPQLTGLAEGTYGVIVVDDDAFFCTDTLTNILIGAPAGFTVDPPVIAGQTDCDNPDGSITFTFTGNYEFRFQGPGTDVTNTTGTLNQLEAGNYSITVRDIDTQCKTTVPPVNIAGPGNCGDSDPESCGAFAFQFDNDGPCGEIERVIHFTNTTYNGTTPPISFSIRKAGTAVYDVQPNNPVFSGNYSAGDYEYLLKNLDNNDICTGTFVLLSQPSVIAFTYTTTEAGCNENGGTLTITGISGGVPPYQVSYQNGAFQDFDESNMLFDNLSKGNKFLLIRDAIGCELTSQIVIPAPNQVVAIIDAPIEPSCNVDGRDGSISFKVDVSQTLVQPPYRFAISRTADQGNLRIHPLNRDINGEYAQRIDTLSYGIYYLFLFSSEESCATPQEFKISGGVQALSFDIVKQDIQCKGESGAVTIKNVVKGPANTFTVEIYKSGSVSPDFTTPLSNLSGSGFPLESLYSFTNGDYQIRIMQEQSVCSDPIYSPMVEFTITEPLLEFTSRLGEVKVSLPDMPTGSIKIEQITGGDRPYEANIKGSDIWVPIQVNPLTLEHEFVYESLNAGDYTVKVRDARGCEKTHNAYVDVDRNIFIPNVFTPNDDGYNETFFVRNLPEEGAMLVVTNRWGKVVYETKGYKNDWTGGTQPDGIYFYKLMLPDTGKNFNGWVEIFRGNTLR